MTGVIGLALAYVLLACLLLLAVLRSDIRPATKLVLVVACAGFYAWHFQSLQSWRGWPASDSLPEHFELIDSITIEPDLGRDQPGAIYVWIRDLDADSPVPRAYRFDYDKSLHRQVDDSLRKQREGRYQVGSPQPGGSVSKPRLEFDEVTRDRRGRKDGSGGS